uniref:Radical SAM superfamily protein n=1 Tax=viral metagenome TaxID=1070528 RepID=A0A6C0ELJ9_9ZZZZ
MTDIDRETKRNEFYAILDEGKGVHKKAPAGTREWSDRSYNIINPRYLCPNECAYCYVKPMSVRFGRGGGGCGEEDIEDLGEKGRKKFVLAEKKVEKAWGRPRKPHKYMFPTSHDIFPEIMVEYVEVVKKMLNAGHSVLCVTKPRLACITYICDALKDFEGATDRFFFRFTIGVKNRDIARKWEKFSTPFSERLDALMYAYGMGFETSVSMEPYLEEPDEIIEAIQYYVTDSIWLGPVNHLNRMPKPDDVDEKEWDEMRAEMESFHSPKKTLARVRRLRHNKKIYWKKEAVEKAIFALNKE